ncbi:MAG: MiaB/RimO family radical SAM methylthiotransferase [Candidatus Omnitrophota bacterium]
MKQKNKIGILSLGCPRNLVDSETILGRLHLKGYQITDMQEADIAIINTCAFIEDAKKESVDAILDLVQLKKEGKIKKILVYGCLSERYKGELLRELPEVDAFMGKVSLNHQMHRYPITCHYAYLKICEGCINSCSFCAIPRIKGKFISLDFDSVLRQAQAMDRQKISEINIIGQDISGYGLDLYRELRLAGLLKAIARECRNTRWLRLLYLHPNRITDELLEVLRDIPKICKYIDLPLQHVNNRVLKMMDRDSSRVKITALIEKIRKAIPQVSLRTSFIVGFPSETDREFKELLKFIKEARFERLGAFIYSREEGTPAYSFGGQIPEEVKQERFNMVMSLQQEVSRQVNKNFLGRSLEVLIDKEENGHYLGRSEYDAPEVDGLVFVSSKKKLKAGDFVSVKINDTLEYDLVGEAEGI